MKYGENPSEALKSALNAKFPKNMIVGILKDFQELLIKKWTKHLTTTE